MNPSTSEQIEQYETVNQSQRTLPVMDIYSDRKNETDYPVMIKLISTC